MKKYNLVIPIAGKGTRFISKDYVLPKPLILIDNKSIVEWTMRCIDNSECNTIFIVRKDHVVNFNIDGYLRSRFGDDVIIVETDKITDGAVCSVLLAEEYIDNDLPLILHCSDMFFEPKFKPRPIIGDGLILTFKSNSTNYSYVVTDDHGVVKQTAEKQVISQNAAVGVYYYKKGSDFVRLAKEMIKRDMRTNGEFYICPLYNLFVEHNMIVHTEAVDKMHIFGTNDELQFFVNNSLLTWPDKKDHVALCCDHSGFLIKERFKNILKRHDISFVDFGVHDHKIDRDYYEYVLAATDAVIKKQCNFGFGFCRSGQGVNISANKVKGIRSAWVCDGYLAEYAIRHNCSNFFAIPEKYVTDDKTLTDILTSWRKTTFDGGRHQVRIAKLET